MRLPSTHDTPRRTAPPMMRRRGPKRSTSVPMSGEETPWTIAEREKAPAARPRDHPNSSRSGTRNTENENISPKLTPSMSQTVTTMSHGEAARGRVTRMAGYAASEEAMDTDIVIIGGGIAGSSAAFHLASHGRRVALLERRDIASEASGLNMGGIDSYGLGHAA